MKRIIKTISFLVFLLLALSGQSQHYYFFTGKVTDNLTQKPLINYPVIIYASDFSFSKFTFTNEEGIFYDSVFTVNKPTTVSVIDCENNEQTVKFLFLDSLNVANFNICFTMEEECQAFFNYEPDSLDFHIIHFTNVSSGNYTNVFWDFGDGSYSLEENPAHFYLEEGIYLVNLIVSDSANDLCFNTFSQLVYVMEGYNCDADFSYELISTDSNQYTYRFNNLSSDNVNFFLWEFGDGTFSVETNPVHTYSNPGTYYVSLYAEDSITFCHDFKIEIITTPESHSFTGTVTDSLTQQPLMNYPVFVASKDSLLTLTTDSSGVYFGTLPLMNNDTVSVYVYDCNNVKIEQTITQLQPENTVNFNICFYHETCQAAFEYYLDSLNNTPYVYRFFDVSTGDTASRIWDFGDGNYSSEQNPVHIYEEGGDYTVTLTVTSPNGECSDTVSHDITTPTYYDFGGQVFIGDFPLNIEPGDSSNQATALLFRKMNHRWYLMDQKDFWKLGYYWFVNKLEGEYLIRIDLKSDAEASDDYAPTYYVDNANWMTANTFYLNDTSYQESIWMQALKKLDNGIGTISGYLVEESRDSLELDNILIELLSGKGEIAAYTYSDENGDFYFDNLPVGTYTVLPEFPGYCGENISVTISAEQPNVSEIKSVIYDCQATGWGENPSADNPAFDFFPNPANSYLTITCETGRLSNIKLEILDLLGNIQETKTLKIDSQKDYNLDVHHLNNGVYIVKLTDLQGGKITTKKLVINH